jgi:hypothetical protein
LHSETLTNIFWGLFFIWFGLLWWHFGGDPVAIVEQQPLFGLGTGIMLIAMNLTRSFMRLKLSAVTMGLGAVLIIVYVPFEFIIRSPLPFLPALLVILGAVLIIAAIRTRNYL